MTLSESFQSAFDANGLVAILRGVRHDQALSIGEALLQAGIRFIEVPLNSPEPLLSIRALRQGLPDHAWIGAGTVLKPLECDEVLAAGAQFIVMPHSDLAVVRRAKALGLVCGPGVATPTEAFAALEAGVDLLKMFPAETLGPQAVKAWRAVLPASVPLVPVGGIDVGAVAAYRAAGARGLGLGSALYRPGDSAEQVAEKARAFVRAWQAAPR